MKGQKCPVPSSGMAFHFLGYTILVLLWACFTAVTADNPCGPPLRREREQPMEDLNAETYEHGHIISYKCRPGYVKAWHIRIKCNDGVWQQLSPSKNCTGISCGHPGDSDYANFELVRGEDFTFGARVVYTCIEGYKMLSQDDYRECRANGWTNDVPHCEVNKCLPIVLPTNVRIIQGEKYQMNEDFLSGDLVIFGCTGRLKIKGSNKITCTIHGTWSAPVPECKEITCEADPIEHGTILTPKLTYKEGERIRFSCIDGYKYVDRPDALCTENGWGSSIQCQEIQCFPPEVRNGHVRPSRPQYMYNAEIQTICNKGFVFGGPGKVSRCTASGWQPPTVCKPRGCDYIRIENGRMQDHYEEYKPFPIWENQRIQFYCYEGFLPVGKKTWQTSTCINSRYVPELKCYKTCQPSQRFNNGHFIYGYWSKFIEGENITFVCERGYSPANQQSTITCTKNGWSPAPRCVLPESEHSCQVSIPNGHFISLQQSFQVNDKAKYNCHDGYTTPEGKSEGETECLAEGWSPEPECIKTCLKPSAASLGFIFNTTKSVFFPGDELRYECEEGRETIKKTISDTVVCKDAGWEPYPGCLPITCDVPILDSGTINPREDRFNHKTVVHFICERQFTRVGSESAQCYHFGWSPQPPICKENVKPCQTPPSISHGTVTSGLKEEYQHGDLLEVQCEISFALQGSKIIECVDGEWAPLPSCIEEEKTCGPPPKITRGNPVNVASSTYQHGETVEYRCQGRSVHIGTNLAKCLHGQWKLPSCHVNPRKPIPSGHAAVQTTKPFNTNQIANYSCGSNLPHTKCVDGLCVPDPRCKETCPPPPQLPNAINIAEMRIYKSEEEISFKCEKHFLLYGPQKIKCENGKWQTPPRCLDLRCEPPPQIDNGVIEIGNRTTFFPNEIVKYSCSSGFEISQSNTVTCENRKWSELPVCKEKSCGLPPEIPNASLQQEDREQYDSGKIINYTCNQGFATKEPTKKTCRKGQWEGSFTCQDITCPVPPTVENAEIVEDTMKKYVNGEKINYQCNDGFEMSGLATVRCTEKKWSPPLPRCQDVRCSSPGQIENGRINSAIKEKYLPQEKVYYQCSPGYALLGSSFITCLKKGWTQPPRCADIGGNCGRPPLVENGDIVELPKATYFQSESVTYQCQSLYIMAGFPRVTCQNGHWSQTPTCRAACTASEEDLREHNLRLRYGSGDKIYSEDGNRVQFLCIRGYKPHPNSRSFTVYCVNGKFEYPTCIPN